MLLHARYTDGDIRPVRTGLHAVLADAGTSEAPAALFPVFPAAVQTAFPSVDRILIGLRFKISDDLFSDHCTGRLQRIADALDHGCRAAHTIAHDVYPGAAGFTGFFVYNGTSAVIYADAAGFIKCGRHALAHCGDHGVRRDLFLFPGLHHAPSAGRVIVAQLHHFAEKPAVLQLHRRQQFHELYAVLHCHDQFFLIRRHVALRPSVYQIRVLHALRAFRRSGCIHGGISAADDDNIFPDIKVPVFRLEIRQEFQGVDRLAFLQPQHARLRRAHCQDNRRIAGIFQHIKIGDLRIQINLDAGLLKKRRILINGLRRDPEFRDHVADHAAQPVCLLEQGGLHPRSAEEICRRHSGRTAADHRSLPASCHRGRRKLLHERVISVLRRDQLHPADIDGFLIEIAGTFAHTRMGADRSRNERERILLCDDLHGLFVFPVFYKLQVRRDILMDRTSFLTGCGKAVQKRHLLLHLPGRERFHRFHVMGIGLCRVHQTLHRLRVDAIEYGAFFFQKGRHLVHPVVSARLQEGRRHRHRPDARLHDVFDIVVIRTARIGDAKLSVKIFRQFCRHGDGQRIQGFA